jgi:hypothetical protein
LEPPFGHYRRSGHIAQSGINIYDLLMRPIDVFSEGRMVWSSKRERIMAPMTLLEAARKADLQILQIHAAFGAPGNYGYESREGHALFELYKFQQELRAAIKLEEAK